MKRLILLLIFVIMFSSVVVADESLFYNDYDLPTNGSVILPLMLVSNETAYITLLNDDEYADFIFPSEVFFDNVSTIDVDLNFSLNDFGVIGNQTLSYNFLINNSYNSLEYNYTLNFTIVENYLVIAPDVFDVKVLNGSRYVNISNNILPAEGSEIFILEGIAGNLVNVTCDGDWITCPEAGLFNDSNLSEIIVDYVIPENASNGEYVFNITFDVINDSDTVNLTFNIFNPDILVATYVWDVERCFSGNYSALLDCVEEYEDWSAGRLSEILRKAREESECEPTVVTETEYVVVGDVDKDLYDELNVCRNESSDNFEQFRECRSNLNNYQKDYELTLADLDSCRVDLLDNESRTRLACESALKAKDNETATLIKKSQRKVNWKIFFSFFVVFLGFGGWFIYKHHDKYKEYD